MDSLSFLQRVYYGYLSRMYGLIYKLAQRTVLGLRFNTLVKWLPAIGFVIAWVRNWHPIWLIFFFLIAFWVNFSLWRAKRDNYMRFIPDNDLIMGSIDLNPLPPNHKVDITVSGLFSVTGRENRLLQKPAKYWYVPLGEHIVMAEESPGKYLYQFFNPGSLQEVQQGWLLHGPQPTRSIAIGFLSHWGPEYTRFGQLYESGKDDLPTPKRVTIYMAGNKEQTLLAIWQTIISEARRLRSELDNPVNQPARSRK
jgi:hypothetical protein